MADDVEDSGLRLHLMGKEMSVVISEQQVARIKAVARRIVREPFTRQAWRELLYLMASAALVALAFTVVTATMALGILLAITAVGVAIMAVSLRSARGFGHLVRALVRGLLHEDVAEPEPFVARPGLFGWLQSALRDTTAWKAFAYLAVKVPLAFLSIYVAFSIWWDAVVCILHPFVAPAPSDPPEFGLVRNLFNPGHLNVGTDGFVHDVAILISGIFLLLLAPWAVRVFTNVDRRLVRSLLGPDRMALRVRSLEQARAQTVDASSATLRRIERDLHDGTQAQLVALALRLGMVKEKLGDPEHLDLDQVRVIVDEAHRGAKEAIVELRDIARGIHPPALDIGLEGALTTLAARSAVPTQLAFSVQDRPTPAIEAIAYFCVAELLSNAAQHGNPSRASVSCTQQGRWLRLVVRDDGRGGAAVATSGSSSSGLLGLTDRVRAVDGQLTIASPPGGPTVITVDLPMAA